ncbi:hypothetical protein EW146_g9509 [Bondarzewia mesenterica]|uniref:Uncharacterized protein n=1 Tax=Bondarzewia mesenterica TaxID=1095465 RepID=A0A4S4L5V1_9AGAM|nr:hypothetical protein EW146_g9509 [Bondarzewia mesenterica]
MTSPLSALTTIIVNGVQTLESAYAKQGLSFPSLDESFKPGPLDDDPALSQTTQMIVAAAFQIIATVRPPIETTVQDFAPSMNMSAALGVVTDVHVADVLKDAGTQGLHVRGIGAKTGIDSSQLARVLRYLATRHVFKEVTPNVFANNRLSSVLIKAKSLDEIKADPTAQYEGAPTAAIVGHITNEGLKSSAYIASYLEGDYKKAAAPFNLAMNKSSSIWDWYEEPGNEILVRRFAAAMKGAGDRFPPSIFTNGFDWQSLKTDEVVVDVGGSMGTVTLMLLKAFPHLRYIIQDLEKVLRDANKVLIFSHDFFTPQPIKAAAVYFLRLVLHDWPQTESKKILKNLREAAGPQSKLVVFDMVVAHACPEATATSDTPPTPKAEVPFPLLANYAAGRFVTMIDLQMLNLVNGLERTPEEFLELGDATGWKLESVKPGPLTAFVFSAM